MLCSIDCLDVFNTYFRERYIFSFFAIGNTAVFAWIATSPTAWSPLGYRAYICACVHAYRNKYEKYWSQSLLFHSLTTPVQWKKILIRGCRSQPHGRSADRIKNGQFLNCCITTPIPRSRKSLRYYLKRNSYFIQGTKEIQYFNTKGKAINNRKHKPFESLQLTSWCVEVNLALTTK